jgi:hypothetical protein
MSPATRIGPARPAPTHARRALVISTVRRGPSHRWSATSWATVEASQAEAPRRAGRDGGVKRSRAIEHLVEMADEASAMLRLRATDIGWALEELWVTGELLTDAATMEVGAVVLVLDLPPDELL